jgi:hypothetical protein
VRRPRRNCACHQNGDSGFNVHADTNTNTDSGTETDADTGTDSDADSDANSGTGTDSRAGTGTDSSADSDANSDSDTDSRADAPLGPSGRDQFAAVKQHRHRWSFAWHYRAVGDSECDFVLRLGGLG